MSFFTILSLLLTLAALTSYVNHRFVGLPGTAALMLISLLLSLGLIAGSYVGLPYQAALEHLLHQVNLSQSLLGGVLSFLLFAGALNIDLKQLHAQRWRVFTLAIVSTLLSIVLIAVLAWLIFRWLGLPTPLLYCLVFGALISPTDPVAVLALLKGSGAPKALETKIAGESLLNDGVGVVAFMFFLASLEATGPVLDLEWQRAVELILREAGGGILLGLALGWLTFLLLRSIDDYAVELLLTLALVTGGYSLALGIGVSGPLAIAVAGIVVGNPGRKLAMSEETRRNLDTFWGLIDEVLNALLFVVVGLQVVTLKLHAAYLLAAFVMVPAMLLTRFSSVGVPGGIFWLFGRPVEGRDGFMFLVWGGLRGGISVALALSLPPGHERDLLLVVTYVVVAFSVLVQGTTMPFVLRRVLAAAKAAPVG